MEWLIKQRMTFYRFALIFYLLALNILFYSSANLIVIGCATIGNFLLILMMIGYSLFEKNALLKNKPVMTAEQTGKRKKIPQRHKLLLDKLNDL